MPRGGHSKSGPLPLDAATRRARGSRTRAHHRRVAGTMDIGSPPCDPPGGLDPLERQYWQYYAPLMAEAGRLPARSRDALGKYCTALATIARLKVLLVSRKPADVLRRDDRRKDLRQWILGSRLIEADLMLSPSSLARSSSGPVAPTPASVDPFAAFVELDADDDEHEPS